MKVLIALDESPSSLRAGREAVRLFSPAGAEMYVVNVSRIAVPWVPLGAYGAVDGLAPGWDAAVAGMDDEELQRLAQEAGVQDPHVLTEMGDPADRICDAADEHDVDVIVVGGHDKNFLERMIAPSVSEAVVRRTDRPVLVVSDR